MNDQKKLQILLKVTGKTQTELAQVLRVSFATLNSWVNGKSTPRKGAQERIQLVFEEHVGVSSIEPSTLENKKKNIAAYKKQFPHPLQHISKRKDLYDTFVLALTYHTNSIEGSTFTEPEVRAVLFDDVTIADKSMVEHQEAKNHQAAWGHVVGWLSENTKGKTITEERIKKLHAILMNGIRSDAGQYRNHAVRIAGAHVPTANHLKVPDRMSVLVKELQRKPTADIYRYIARTHAEFEQIHPFSDGNGRIGRLLMHMQAFQNGLPPVLIRQEKKQAYFSYLQRAQVEEEHIFLESFICDAILESYAVFISD